MKNKSYRLFISIFLLTLIGLPACKNKDLDVDSFEIERESVVTTADSVSITGSYSFAGTVKRMKVNIGKKESLIDANAYEMQMEGTGFSVSVGGLKPSTEYYYRYSIDFGTNDAHLTETKSFTTLDAVTETPTVKTLEVLAIDSTTFRIDCKVESDGGQQVTECGICWNTYGNPNLSDDTLHYSPAGVGDYSCRITNLTEHTHYYVRAYAKNPTGTSLGNVLEFHTGGIGLLPQVSTVELNNVTFNSATCLGNVASNGGLELIERGVCWGLEPYPTINVHNAVAEGTETGNFTVDIDGLTPNTTYHVRCYATNEKGTSYGEELTFTTTTGLPTVTTSALTNISATSATGGGEVTDQGASNVTERGVCWGTSHNPTISGTHGNSGTGMGNYTVSMTNLTPNATYYVRAYATNAQGTAYGAEVSFTALEGLPVVVTLNIIDITSSTAKGHGKVTDQGGSAVTERGICWSTNPSPSISGSHAPNGTGAGEYTVSLSNLMPGTKYYVRAYATNAQGTTYGEQKDFTTATTLPTVVTGDINGTTVHGEVTNSGGAIVTERGICWSMSHNPTISGSHNSSGTGTGTFSVELTNLEPGTTYYVRAYATNSAGTAYGIEKALTTQAALPTVTTGEVSNITQTTAQGSGNVTNDGGATVTERGVCWSTSHNPTISGSHDHNGTGTGGFTVSMNGLTANTHYYVRAYAKNSAGVSYGNEVGFTTAQNVSAPTVTTSQVTNVTQTTATGGGNVTSDGGATVTERGICWSTSHNPTTMNSHANSGTGTGTFSVNMTSLTPNTTYYVRAYAVNSAGTSYGSEVSFTTLQATTVPTVTTSEVTNIQQTTATGGGNVTNDGGATVTERGICWSTSHNPTISGSHAHNGTGTGGFTVDMNDLTPNTTYYVRAYAINSAGTSYGSEVSFTTLQIYIITVSANPTYGGNVTGGGPYLQGPCTVSAEANNGYTFVNWTENDNVVSTNANYTFTVTGDRTLVANFQSTTVPQGAIDGEFTINANGDKVYFSRGNLQYKASTNVWRFAPTQYNYIGEGNTNISQSYNGWIDLFGWGTSGWNNGNTYYHPWDNGGEASLYGPPGQHNLTGSYANADWGVYNPISNGGNTANQWRTLTQPEWSYLFLTRVTASGIRYAKANVNYVNGVILLPDDWDASYFSLNDTNTNETSYSSNTITDSEWGTMEQHGAVFLPAAGSREGTGGTSVYNVGSEGGYWSASSYSNYGAYHIGFQESNLYPNYSGSLMSSRQIGLCVRLVRSAR